MNLLEDIQDIRFLPICPKRFWPSTKPSIRPRSMTSTPPWVKP